MKLVIVMIALPLAAQQVTISSQPGQAVIASLGAQLTAVSVYSAEVCSSPGVVASGSWGQIRQIAEQNGLNVIDPVLVPATAQRAQNKTATHKAVQIVGVIGMATLFAAVFHSPPPWLLEGAATLTGGAQVLGSYLSAGEAQAQTTLNAVLADLLDPTSNFSISNGACIQSKLFFGNSIRGFRPIIAQLPIGPISVPATRREEPRSEVPGAFTHPATNDIEVAGWELPLANIEYIAFSGVHQ